MTLIMIIIILLLRKSLKISTFMVLTFWDFCY